METRDACGVCGGDNSTCAVSLASIYPAYGYPQGRGVLRVYGRNFQPAFFIHCVFGNDTTVGLAQRALLEAALGAVAAAACAGLSSSVVVDLAGGRDRGDGGPEVTWY